MLHSIYATADFGLKLLRCSWLYIALTVVLSSVCAAAQISVRVSDEYDDAEEHGNAPGSMSRSSTDLELNYDGSIRQVIGIRFQNVTIPAGATINSAYIQFTTDEVDTGTTNVVIYGEDANNPLAYSNTSGDISDRDKTSESETWSISAWNTVGQTHDSPDLTRIVQEIVDRSGWAQNNSMAFIIEPAASCNSSTCQRTAESYNGSTSSAPLLVIDYDASVSNHAEWRSDETLWNGTADEVNDSSGNAFHGTANSMTTTSGQICQAGDYSSDSVSDYVILDADGLDGLNDFSISAWIKTSTATYSAVLSGANASVASGNEVLMWFPTGTQFEPWIQGTRGSTITTANIADDQWHHALWTRSGAQNCFYLDGTLQGCASLPAGAVDIDAGGLIIGQDQDSLGGSFELSQNWQGLIDELLIFDGSLDSASVQSIYTNQLAGNNWDGTTRTCPVLTNLAADWRLDESVWNGTSDEVKDDSGNTYHGTANSVTTTTGKICEAGDFAANGTADYLDLDAGALDGLSDFSISAWIKTDTATYSAVLSGANASVTSGNEVLMWFPNGTQFEPWIQGTRGSTITTTNITDDQWHHAVWTRSGAQNCFYLDGALQGCVNLPTGPVDIDAGGLLFGQDQDSLGGSFELSQNWQGLIDEVLIFSNALSSTSVQSIYTNQQAGNNWDGSSRTCPLLSGALAEWRLDEASWDGTADEVADSSGNGNHGVTLTGVQATTSGQVCGAADIPANSTDSEQEAIDTGVDVDDEIGNEGSISLWYKSNADWSGGGDRALFDASSNPVYFFLLLQSSGALRFGLEDTNDLDVRFDAPAQTFSAGQWVHIAVTWDLPGDSFQIFVNGALVTTNNLDSSGLLGELDTLYLGDNRDTYHPGGTGSSADGSIDEWLVFQQVLSASEINSIFQNQLAGNNWDGTARVCPTVSDIAFGFNCVESGLDALTGNLYTKTVGQSFSVDVAALKDSDNDGAADAIETDYANGADRTVTVELIDTSSAAACSAYPALSPAVSQSLVFSSSDAGRKASAAMSSNVAYRSVGCRVTDNTDTASPVFGCSTDSFAVRPTTIAVSSNMTNSGSSGGPTTIAGANFTMTATATVGYDGTPSLDSSKLEAHAAASRIGSVSGTFGSADSATGIATAANFTYDEVGNFRYLAEGVFDSSFTAIDQTGGDCIDDFSNTVVGGKVGCKFGNTGATDYFGRFVPDHFTLSGGFITNRIDRACAALSNFTYMDEYFQAVFLLAARNLAGNTTQNYAGAYARLDPIVPSNFDFTALNIESGVTNLTGRLNIRSSIGLWLNGSADITTDLAVSRLTNPDGAYTALNVGINPVDSDGVALNSFDLDEDLDTVDEHAAVGQTDVRNGRLSIANAHGSELLTLPVPLTAQYYSSSGIGFVTNTDDSCTAIAIGNLTLSNNVETGQNDGDIDIQISPSITTQATIANTILGAGDAALTFCPPGNPACTPAAGNTGYVDIEVAAPSYLQFDWFGAGLANPKARASFGLFKGRGNQIFMREVY